MATVKAFIRSIGKTKIVKIRLRLTDGRSLTRYGVTDIELRSDLWDAKKEDIKSRVILPDNIDREEISTRIKSAKEKVLLKYKKELDKDSIPTNFIDLALVETDMSLSGINKYANLEELPIKYLDIYKVSDKRKQQIKISLGILYRFLMVHNLISYSEVNPSKLELFIRDEYLYQDKHPLLYNDTDTKKKRKIVIRAQNTINAKLKMIRTFYAWLASEGVISIDPFLKFDYTQDIYGDPVPLLPEEVELMFNSTVPDRLAIVRDMFCLQCYIGCRVGDFISLTKENVNDDILIYVADKTKSKNTKTVYVPLIDNAAEIISRYNCEDGRLLPFINISGKDGYNKKIKELATYIGLNRRVAVINPVTQKTEIKPIHDVISSHTARKTFINSNYKETQDPNLISKMTGHIEGSLAFNRYRKIDMDILRNQMKKAFKNK
ncbi:MAG: tyrosine-type recombinase/integrase [Dysgonomonas sp.]